MRCKHLPLTLMVYVKCNVCTYLNKRLKDNGHDLTSIVSSMLTTNTCSALYCDNGSFIVDQN